jgi:DNA-3-methyladenine glycosylase
MVLPTSFFNRDALDLAPGLLGKRLVHKVQGGLRSGLIVETEAYRGRDDRACHAFGYKKTNRTAPLFGPPGHAYVYLCYGIHALFNVVANIEGEPEGVLIRALFPEMGVETMGALRPGIKPERLASGPGSLTRVLGIGTAHTGKELCPENHLWIEDGLTVPVEATTRIGVAYAGPDAALPWRFVWKGHPSVSVKPGK